MSKPTPGPWSVATHFNGRVTVQTQGFRPIATVTIRKSDESDCHANAHLLAAAWELLEALKGFPMLLTPATTAWGKQVQEWQDKALAAIARAEGGQS